MKENYDYARKIRFYFEELEMMNKELKTCTGPTKQRMQERRNLFLQYIAALRRAIPYTMDFSQWLLLQLEDMKIDKTTAAQVIGVSRNSLYRWINGDSFPSLANLKNIAKIVAEHRGISIDAILEELTVTIQLELLK